MTKIDFLMKFRACKSLDTLDIVFNRISERKLESADLLNASSAYDHRKAEIVMGKLYDKVPASVWKFVD